MRKAIFIALAFGFLGGMSQLHADDVAGRTYTHIVGQDFPFTSTYGEFAGLTFNPLTQTFFMTDNQSDVILEIDSAGNLLRTINISNLKNPAETTTDAEGIAWMFGTQYALVMEGGEEMAIVQIGASTTTLTRSNATIFDLFGDPKGIAYRASENALYFISEDTPKRVVKSHIDASNNLIIDANHDVDTLPMTDLGDIAFFPRLSSNPFLISQSSKTIVEVDLQSGTPIIRSTFSLSAWDIPRAGGLAFGANANMYVVGKHVSSTPEDDFSVFAPTAPVVNQNPAARITVGP